MEELSKTSEECNNTSREIKQEDLKKIISDDSKVVENYNESETRQKQELLADLLKCNNNSNNNHHVVPVGIIILLMTTYLGMTSIKKCLVSCVEEITVKDQPKQINQELIIDLLKPTYKENSFILERLLEYKDICKDLEIFTKNNNLQQSNYEVLKQFKSISDVEADVEDSSSINTDDGEASGASVASGSGSCVKESRNKNKKSKYSIKSSANTKSGFNKYNKSSKAKYNKSNNKKELNLNKKNSTAEPIIYLFALVFIYLLLKAASDINQHYKSQNKNDKRLRRCSLQSYAQTHRQDRRASKELALKQKQQQQQQQRLKSLSQSSNPVKQYHHPSKIQTPKHFMEQLTETFEHQQQKQQHITNVDSPRRSKMTYSSNWQILRQHTTTQSLDRSDLLANTIGECSDDGGKKEFLSRFMARRCSVPVALSYQRQKMSAVSPPLNTVSDHNINVSLSRRTSITSNLPLAMDPNDSFLPETKRRVRMINRH